MTDLQLKPFTFTVTENRNLDIFYEKILYISYMFDRLKHI